MMALLKSRWFWLILFTANFILRLPTLWTPILDIDESQFAEFAHVLMDGGLPFIDSLDTKPLGIYLWYASLFFVFGKQAMWAIHLATTLWVFLTAFCLSRIFYEFGRRAPGRAAALLYIIFASSFIPKFLATSINSVMVLFLVLSVWMVVRGDRKGGIRWDLLGGLSLGVAFLFKYQAGIQTVWFTLFLLPFWVFRTGQGWGRFILRHLLFGGMFLLPFVIHGLVLAKVGAWDDFSFWSFEGSRRYISSASQTVNFWGNLSVRFGGFVVGTAVLWMLAFWGLWRQGIWTRQGWKDPLFVMSVLWLAMSWIPVSMGARFFSHYFIQILPALCAVAALKMEGMQFHLPKWMMGLMAVLVIVFFGMRLDHRAHLEFAPDDQIYEQQAVGEFLQSVSQEDDHLFVWGFATNIYFHSKMRPSSRFLWTDWQTGRVPGSKGDESDKKNDYKFDRAWDELWQDFQDKPPKFFVDASGLGSKYQDHPISRYPDLNQYLVDHFNKLSELEGVVVYQRR